MDIGFVNIVIKCEMKTVSPLTKLIIRFFFSIKVIVKHKQIKFFFNKFILSKKYISRYCDPLFYFDFCFFVFSYLYVFFIKCFCFVKSFLQRAIFLYFYSFSQEAFLMPDCFYNIIPLLLLQEKKNQFIAIMCMYFVLLKKNRH